MSKLNLLWQVLTHQEPPGIGGCKEKLASLETKTEVLEGMAAFRRMTHEDKG